MSKEFQHVNEKITHEKYGYYSDELSKFSSKKIIVTCIDCNDNREIKKSNLYLNKNHSIRCNNCQRKKHIVSVRKDPTGTKHSEETKKKIGASNKISQKKGKDSFRYGKKISLEHKSKIIETNKSRIWSEESRKKISDKHKGKKLSIEHIKNKSIAQTGEKNHRYGKVAAHSKGQYYTTSTGSIIWVRSSWEIKTIQYLEINKYNWEYEPQAFPITYEHNGKLKNGTFRPDFKVNINGSDEYWEIKGFWRDDAKIKFDAFCKQYPKFHIRLLQKENLLKLGIKV